MPPTVQMDRQTVLDLIDASMTRVDVLESYSVDYGKRIRDLELELATSRGVSSVWGKVVPWLALIVGVSGLLVNAFKH